MIKKSLIGIGIFILTLFVVIYGIDTFYSKPLYDNYCERYYYSEPISKPDICPSVCVEMYEIGKEGCFLNKCGSGCGPNGYNTFETLEECKEAFTQKYCYEDYEKANEKYKMVVFIITLIIGILLIIAGFSLFKLDNVGASLMAGGIASLIYGAGGYWRYTENWLKFVMSLAGLIILIGFTYWIEKRVKKKK